MRYSMPKLAYEIETAVAGFDTGNVIEVIAQYGDWHVYDVKVRSQGAGSAHSAELTWNQLREHSSPIEAT